MFHLEDALSTGRSPPTTSGAPSSQEETTDTVKCNKRIMGVTCVVLVPTPVIVTEYHFL